MIYLVTTISKFVNRDPADGEKIMPRLIGKQSNNSWYVTLVLIAAIAAAGSLEYLGVINVVPGFGGERSLNERSSVPLDGD